jgi:hypothetical protein
MRGYTRPSIEEKTFYDTDGDIIEYGDRWSKSGGTPPDESYSVDSNLERFAPVHAVAEALIEHLIKNYAVTVEESDTVLADLTYPPEPSQVTRAVRLTPQAKAAPLTFVFTRYPSVFVHAGAAVDLSFPSCGCDACDETWQSGAQALEWQTFAVVSGGLTEYIEEAHRRRWRIQAGMGLVRGFKQAAGYELKAADGSQSVGGGSDAPDMPAHAVERLLRLSDVTVDGTWQPWQHKRSA